MSNSGINIERQVVKTRALEKPSKSVSLPESLTKELKSVDSKYASELSKWTNKKQNVTLKEEDAKQIATNNLSDYYKKQNEKRESTFEKKQSTLEDKKANEKLSFYEKMKNLNDTKEENLRDLKTEALEKGWRNSSIYEGLKEAISKSYQNERNEIETKNISDEEEFNFQKSFLEEEKESALESFNIAYAQKLSQQIEKITKEFNKIHKKEQQEVEKNLLETNRIIEQEKTATVLKYLIGSSKKDALKFLEENEENLTKQLGQVSYRALFGWVEQEFD